jgi:transposase-like protein
MRLPRSSKYWSEAEGRAVIEAWRRSGESRSAFARRHGLQTKRLKYWAGRLSRADGPVRTLALMPATVVGADLSAVIRAGEVTIELSSATPEQVATIAQALARSTS